MKKVVLVIIGIIMLGAAAQSKEPNADRGMGMGASFQGEQSDVLLQFPFSESITFGPYFRFFYAEDRGFDYGIGAFSKFYINNKKVSPFICAQLGIMISSPEVGDNLTDIIAGGGVGMDYFLDNNISIGIHAMLVVTKSDDHSSRFGNPGGVNINTSTGLTAFIYL